jgi:hypothetical protein
MSPMDKVKFSAIVGVDMATKVMIAKRQSIMTCFSSDQSQEEERLVWDSILLTPQASYSDGLSTYVAHNNL